MKNQLLPAVPCHIPELNIHCFGCCGNSFSSKKEILKDILLNTEELTSEGTNKDLSQTDLIKFRDRFDGDNALSENGLCYNLVELDSTGSGCFGCPLHNMVDKILPIDSDIKIDVKEDLRVGHCDINEECQTFSAWKNMAEFEKKKFILFVKKFEFDSYTYSVENGAERLFGLFKKFKSSKN